MILSVSAELALDFARVALANLEREYPRRVDFVLTGAHAEWRPRHLHPAFYGSYDWHSSVHMHWLLVRLMRLHPVLEAEIAPVLEARLSEKTIDVELAFFRSAAGRLFERPYGWAWLLALRAELLEWRPACDRVRPLAEELAGRFAQYIGSLPYPVRAGTHANSAFACILALHYAVASRDSALERAIESAAKRWYQEDRRYPVAYEPSGDDFLSPALVEALLVKKVLPEAEFAAWFDAFLPRDLAGLSRPPHISDHSDAKQSHLDGLCLSRAWCFLRLGFAELAELHLQAGLPHVVGGHYAGEHWLASFAALALSAEALKNP